jgi:hypothetical protein
MDQIQNSIDYCIMEDCVIEDCMSINERKKVKDQKLVEESDNRLTECLFSNDPHKMMKPSETKKQIIEKRMDEKKMDEHDHYDLNDYSYDYCDNFDIEDKYLKR